MAPSIMRLFRPHPEHSLASQNMDEPGSSSSSGPDHPPLAPNTPDLSDLLSDAGDDEGLPEVYSFPDMSPQVISPEQSQSHWYRYRQNQSDKYPVQAGIEPVIPGGIVSDGLTEGPFGIVSPLEDASPWESLDSALQPQPTAESTEKALPPIPEPRICGFRRRTLFIVLGVALLFIIVGVGAGVGGAMAVANASHSAASSTLPATATVTVDPTPATASPSGTALTTQFLTNGTAPRGFAFQGFEGANYTGDATGIYQTEGFYNLSFPVTSYVWLPDISGCCVTFCSNMTYSGGYWCAERYRLRARNPFTRISIWCGADYTRNATCS